MEGKNYNGGYITGNNYSLVGCVENIMAEIYKSKYKIMFPEKNTEDIWKDLLKINNGNVYISRNKK